MEKNDVVVKEKKELPLKMEKNDVVVKEKKELPLKMEKNDVVVKEKKELPLKMEKEKINVNINNTERIPTEKIKPRLKPKFNKILPEKNSDLSIDIKKKPEAEFNIASMLKDLRNEKSVVKKEDLKPEKKEEINQKLDETFADEDAQLTISEIDLVLQQLSQCFIGQTGVKIEPSMYVKITATIRQNRRVIESSIRIVDTNISKSSSVFRPITESAMRTLLNPNCIPLKLPENKYEIWKNLTMTFDYSVMRGN